LNRPGNADALAPIYGMTTGLVIFAGLLPSTWGDVIVVQYETDGVIIYARHAHVDSYLVSAGQQIEQGQLLGYVGNANGQLPHHLHFDLSPTNILKTTPGHWPGDNLLSLRQNYIEPRGLLLASREGLVGKALFVKSAANFRAGPKTSYLVYSVLQSGTQVVAMGAAVDDYNLVRVGTEYGFVHKDLLQEAVPPSPPVEVDMLPYIKGDGRLFEVRNEWGSQQRHQSQAGAGSEFFQTKDNEWEQMFATDTYIIRDIDTSPGGGRYYRLKEGNTFGSAWIPRKWNVGDTFTRSRFVQFFNKQGCVPVLENSGDVTDTMKFAAKHVSYAFRTGIILNDVVELEWVTGMERYFYARDFGLVAWERSNPDPNTPQWSAISEIHAPGARPDNIRETINCL
jgi:Peptidase family M23